VVSFGFKHGLPAVCDLVFDLRFLPNPYHVPELRMQSGLDAEVREFVLGSQAGSEFQEHFREFLRYVIPQYAEEGKAYLTIGIGCTGGRHRSVAAAEATAAWIRSLGYTVTVRHRDLRREGRRATDRARGEPGVEAAVPSLPDNHPVDTAVRPSIERRSGE
jgi:UPF0042 nucleotide-binding protein